MGTSTPTKFWLAAIAWLVLDGLTKLAVIREMELGQSIALLPNLLHLTYAINTGAAFSLFKNSVDLLKWVSLGVSLVLISLPFWQRNLSKWEQWGYGSILGGAIGNGIDRFVHGHVIDFVDLPWLKFPIFNVADVAINIGIICLGIGFFTQPSDRV
ncbi:MAG: signal peptidase II [Pseudanabaenaceae cyanobacterium bins.68]|nr:signal peptidase II [Pseudanabaenaceae cyanobacterium bins.68]